MLARSRLFCQWGFYATAPSSERKLLIDGTEPKGTSRPLPIPLGPFSFLHQVPKSRQADVNLSHFNEHTKNIQPAARFSPSSGGR